MEGATEDGATDHRTTARVIFRPGIAGLVLGPGASELRTYEQSVQFSRTLAIPTPAVVVFLGGGIELAVAAR